jgi:serine protease AprX
MATVRVLVEVEQDRDASFSMFEAAVDSEREAVGQAEELISSLAGLHLDLDEELTPIPMLSTEEVLPRELRSVLGTFGEPEENPDVPATSMVVACEVDRDQLDRLQDRTGVRVWPNSDIHLLAHPEPMSAVGSSGAVLDPARSRPALDCRPYRPGVDLATVRELLGVQVPWDDGVRGQNVTVAILDDGIDGSVYPVVDGFARPGAQQPGAATPSSHGSMCAADVLVAAPWARLADYPFLGVPRSGGALAMFQAVLDQRRRSGAPHVTNNSWGYVAVPSSLLSPRHEIHDLNHPLHRKVREVVAAGVVTFFAAGNCGEECPSGACHTSSIGPGKSVHGSNSLAEVITIAAVNHRHERIGYSSQGPGMFAREKPDLSAYSHFFGNFGPDRPGGTGQPFDNGTSAATPVAAGVAALLLSAFPDLSPDDVRHALERGATRVEQDGWDRNYGRGIINAAASYARLRDGRS